MGFSLPGIYLKYLPHDNLDPEKFEQIISPHSAWSRITAQYEFSDSRNPGFYLLNICERRNNPGQQLPPLHGPCTRQQMKKMVMSGDVVMLCNFYEPAGVFYIDQQGDLISQSSDYPPDCIEQIIREYQRSVSCRDYSQSGGKPRPTVLRTRQRSTPLQQHAQSVRKNPVARDATPEPEPREITLTIGVFFDGTGNNSSNSTERQNACSGEHFGLSSAEAESAQTQCVKLKLGHSGTAAGSHLGYYTNVHWLFTLYNDELTAASGSGQEAIYIEGIGTENGEGDSAYGMMSGRGDTGVVSKTDKAVGAVVTAIQDYLSKHPAARASIIKKLQFDIFGFSRGAAAARHFANRVASQDVAIIAAIKTGLEDVTFTGTPGGSTRFLGIFDTVAAIGTPVNGMNPHSADTGEVNIVLRPGVAQKVFQITARHESRFNFALNSIQPAWPELALPGAHSDIGGGYNPDEYEACFVTRPYFTTVPLSTPDSQTRSYQQAAQEQQRMADYPAIAPLLQQQKPAIHSWSDERLPADRYGTLQKRSAAALVLERPTRNDWSKVVLRVMLDAAQEAGAVFNSILPKDSNLSLPAELNILCEKARLMGRAARNGQLVSDFSPAEMALLAGKYLHCSAHWNSVVRDKQGQISGAVKPLALINFTNRPDRHWQRTVYNMDGNKI